MKKLKYLLFVSILFIINSSCGDSFIDTAEPTMLDEDFAIEKADVSQEYDTLVVDTIADLGVVLGDGKYIYLTIDDGPLYGGNYIDSVVTVHQVKTNLFVVGSAVDGSQRFKKYYDKFTENKHIEIYNHSYSHANHKYANFYKNPDLVLQDFQKNQSQLAISHKVARLPGRNLWSVGNRTRNVEQSGSTSAALLAAEGYDVYGWDVEWDYDSKDYVPKQTVDELVEKINTVYENKRTFTAGHVVVLMHDQMFSKMNDKNDLGELITKLKNKGYEFEYMTAYPKTKN